MPVLKLADQMLCYNRILQVTYSSLMHGLEQQNIQLNRKMLSELAMHEPCSFKALVDQVKFMRGMPTTEPTVPKPIWKK